MSTPPKLTITCESPPPPAKEALYWFDQSYGSSGTKQQSPEIVVIGSANIDLVAYAPRLPLHGETVLGTSFETTYGGKGANQAVAASRLYPEEDSDKAACVCKLGSNSFGREYYNYLKDSGLCTGGVMMTREADTGVAHITVAEDGENSIIIIPGANNLMIPDDLHHPRIEKILTDAKVILCQNEIPAETSLEAFKIAKSSQSSQKPLTIFTPAPAESLPKEIFTLTDYLILNEVEAQKVARLLTSSVCWETPRNCEAMAAAISKENPEGTAIITLGKEGCFVRGSKAPGEIVTASPVPDNLVVDTVGAGDCFTGAFAFFLTLGCSAKEAAHRATVVAAESVRRRGASTSYLGRSALPQRLFTVPS